MILNLIRNIKDKQGFKPYGSVEAWLHANGKSSYGYVLIPTLWKDFKRRFLPWRKQCTNCCHKSWQVPYFLK